MTRADVLAKLRAHEAELRAAGVEALWLFGSFARDEAGEGSDVDLLFDRLAEGRAGHTARDTIREQIAAIVDRKVDLVTRDVLMPRMRARVEASILQVF